MPETRYTGACTLEALKMTLHGAPGLLEAVAEDLGASPAEVKAMAIAGELKMRDVIPTAERLVTS